MKGSYTPKSWGLIRTAIPHMIHFESERATSVVHEWNMRANTMVTIRKPVYITKWKDGEIRLTTRYDLEQDHAMVYIRDPDEYAEHSARLKMMESFGASPEAIQLYVRRLYTRCIAERRARKKTRRRYGHE